jgi:alkylhydroperoxidase/carboxymuconolactone decarboxylase family protein YurZ
VFLQLMGYVGAPLARQAFIIAQRVFPEFRTAAQS